MKVTLLSLSFFILCFSSGITFGTHPVIYIKDLGFDPQSKEFRITYTDPSKHSVTTLKDSGPLPLCVVEQLLLEYYRRMSTFPDNERNPNLSQKHMVLINQLAATLPHTDGEQIRESLRQYIQQYRKGGGPVMKAVKEVTLNIMKDRKISSLEEIIYDPEKKQQIEGEIKQLTARIYNTKNSPQDNSPDLKTLLLRSLEGRLSELKRNLQSMPSQSSKKEKQIPALESIFCAASLTPFILKNDEIGGLLDKLSKEVTEILPKTETSRTSENETHF